MSRARRRPYPSDLSDAEWALLEPLLASSEKAWPSPEVVHPAHSRRRLLPALRSGCAWRMLPREYPPWQGVYYHFRKWRRDGRLRQAHDRLRATGYANRRAGIAIPAGRSWTAK
jgi:putative transposase